jgi:hypothetical protein
MEQRQLELELELALVPTALALQVCLELGLASVTPLLFVLLSLFLACLSAPSSDLTRVRQTLRSWDLL